MIEPVLRCGNTWEQLAFYRFDRAAVAAIIRDRPVGPIPSLFAKRGASKVAALAPDADVREEISDPVRVTQVRHLPTGFAVRDDPEDLLVR